MDHVEVLCCDTPFKCQCFRGFGDGAGPGAVTGKLDPLSLPPNTCFSFSPSPPSESNLRMDGRERRDGAWGGRGRGVGIAVGRSGGSNAAAAAAASKFDPLPRRRQSWWSDRPSSIYLSACIDEQYIRKSFVRKMLSSANLRG